MNERKLSPRQIRGRVADRFYYRENIPRKDAAVIANCPDRDVRRRWVQRILDHDGAGHPWMDPPGLAYFKARLSRAPRDSGRALQVKTRQCRTPGQQTAAVAALSFKCDVRWTMLDAIDQAYADR